MTATNFSIMAVKNLCRQEQEDWWDAVVSDRVARSALFGMREDEKTFKTWAEMAAWPGYDLNVVYGPGEIKVGYFWTCGKIGHGAFMHFNFLSGGLFCKEEAGRYVLKVLWACGYKCLAGLIPVGSRHVMAFARSVGGRVMGRWPGVCYVAARDEWVDAMLFQFKPEGD